MGSRLERKGREVIDWDALIAEFYGEGDKRRGQHWGEKRAAGNPHKYPQKASHTPRIHTKIVASQTSQSWRDRLERFRKEMNEHPN